MSKGKAGALPIRLSQNILELIDARLKGNCPEARGNGLNI
jgi:hypothetical protein